MTEIKLPNNLLCLMSHDPGTTLWINHCLNFDIVTSGTSEEDAWQGMKRVLKSHVESCVADNFVAGLSKKADADAWRAFIDQALVSVPRSEPIEFDFKEKDGLSGICLKGVEVESLPSPIHAGARRSDCPVYA